MNSKNIKILKQLVNQKLKYEDLLEKGIEDNTLIINRIIHNDGLFSKTVYIKKRFYEGVTLEVENNEWFIFSSNNFTKEKVKNENKILETQNEIEALNNNIYAYRFEFNLPEKANELEKKKRVLESILKTIRSLDKLRDL